MREIPIAELAPVKIGQAECAPGWISGGAAPLPGRDSFWTP